VDGKEAVPDQAARFVTRLKYYRDRMLQVDWRNRSIFLRRPDKKYALDLGALWDGDERKLDEALKKAVWTRSSVTLLKDSERDKGAEEIRSNIVSLERTSRTILEETGMSDTYLGYPFIVGHACPDSYVRAPLVLFPVKFERVRYDGIPGWYLIFNEDESPVLNRALIAALRRVCGLTLPDDLQDRLDDLMDEAPREGLGEFLLMKLQDLLSDYLKLEPLTPLDKMPTLNTLTSEDVAKTPLINLRLMPFALVGSFPQGSTAIFRDYEEMIDRASKGEVDQGVVDDVLEAQALRSIRGAVTKQVDVDSTLDREINTVLPSDSSQDLVLLEAQQAEAVVVRGPPGTGKSQVITNLITNALAKGQKVLVVCQKRAALDVVYQRLGRAGLADAAVLLHDARADRTAVYASIAKRMNGDPPPLDEAQERMFWDISAQIDATVAELNLIVKPLWKEMPNGAKPRDLYLRARPGYVPKLDLGTIPFRIAQAQLTALLQRLPDLQAGFLRFDRPSYPWSGRASFAPLDLNARFSLDATLSKAIAAAAPQALLVGSPQEQEAALVAIGDYLSLEGKALKSLNPKWRAANRAFNSLQSSKPGDPRTANAQEMQRSLLAGKELSRALDDLSRWMTPDGAIGLRSLGAAPNELGSRLEAMRAALVDFDKVQEHDRAAAALDPLSREVHDLCRRRLPAEGEQWAAVVEQEVVLRWIVDFESRDARLSGEPFSRYLDLKKRLASLLDQRRELLRRRLVWRTLESARRPQLPPGEHHPNRRAETDWNKLINELTKKRRVKPPRKLVEEYQFQLMTVAPIWLMSPEAASEVFPLQRGMFDLVIFDESSQLAVERALPSLYRGKRVLIAGDEKQLRPFDLFQTREGDEELDEVTEAESLLVLSMRIMTPRYLSWHYRSKYQELIDFSNHAFYDGNLEISANVQRRFESAPIDFVRVDGVWEERTNPKEAEKVVDVVNWLLSEGESKGRMPSVGVITFNEQQRDLVEDAIERRRSQDKEFDRLYAAASSPQRNLDDRPFVKNIENVQGDERDAIIFSVAYAKDASGKMRVQFGPLNQEGGENRLNVAVTRARERVVVVASFEPAELPVEDVKNLGPKRLKDYLLYAQMVSTMRRDEVSAMLKRLDGGAPTAAMAAQDLGPSLERQVKEALQAQGLKVEERVGFSGYKIDLAVVDPNDDARYVLGIEGDGQSFQSARSARERDVIRQRYLEDRGWAVERVWSRNWWRDRGGEVQRLTGRAVSLSEETKKRVANPTAAPASIAKAEVPSVKAEDRREEAPLQPPQELPYQLPAQVKEGKAMRLAFFQQLESWSIVDADAAKAILDFCDESEMRFWWHDYRGLSAVTPYLVHKGQGHYFFTIRADGALDLHFQSMVAPFDSSARRLDLLRRLNAASTLGIPEDYSSKWRTVMLEKVRGERALDGFVKTLRWYIEEVKRS
jgi:very-short-patch-repair endonuclease